MSLQASPGQRAARSLRRPRRPPGYEASRACLFLLALLAFGCAGAAPTHARVAPSAAHGSLDPCDVVIEHGRLVDGTGRPAFAADLAVRDGAIVAVTPPGELRGVIAKRRIDAKGLVIAPGFIDVLSQSQRALLGGEGRMLNKLTQGVTTEVLGEGWTSAPSKAPRFAGPRGFGAWLLAMEQHGNTTNVASFVGATTLRRYAMDDAAGPPSPEQQGAMREALRLAMEDGAMGLGTALIYPPGSFATTEELVDLAKVMAPYHGVYATHLRSEGDRLTESLDEAIEIGRRGGVAVEVFHVKAMGRRNWPKLSALLDRIRAARAAGLDITADTFPYTKSGTMLSALLPPWASADGKLLGNLTDEATRRRIHAALLGADSSWENLGQLATPEEVTVTEAPGPETERWVGKRLSEVATAMGTDWADAAIQLLIATRGEGSMLCTTMDEEGIRLKLREPWIMFGTDAGERTPSAGRGVGHPRAMGTYPRVLGRYVRELRLLSLEEAVRRMSSAVARKLSIQDRGVLAAGARADVVIFDPDTIADRATEEEPLLPSVGVLHVLVNGVLVLDGGALTGERPGRIVRGPGWRGASAEPPQPARAR